MEKLFGELKTGEKIYKYSIKGENISAEITNYGAAIVKLFVFGRDVVGGFDTLEDYILDDSYQGAVIGRVANRIKNSEFKIDGNTYRVTKNDGDNCLHGGCGFDKKAWQVLNHSESSITLAYTSKDDEEGFPASLNVTVTYTAIKNTLLIDYKAVADGKTPIALTNHSYFNLDGLGGDIKKHKVKIYAKNYTATDEQLIPTGERPSVIGTPYDFIDEHEVGERFSENFFGYDTNFILSKPTNEKILGKDLSIAAELSGEKIKMTLYTNMPGVQFYTASFLDGGVPFKDGIPKIKYGALCLETQTEPNSVNLGLGIYDKDELYTHTSAYRFDLI